MRPFKSPAIRNCILLIKHCRKIPIYPIALLGRPCHWSTTVRSLPLRRWSSAMNISHILHLWWSLEEMIPVQKWQWLRFCAHRVVIDWLFFFVVVVNLFIWFWFFTLFENAVVENVAGLSQWQFSHGRVHSFPPTWSHCCRVSRTRTSCCRSAINYRYIFAINSYILTTYYHRIESCSIVIISMTLQQRNGSCKLTSQSIQSYHQL